MRGKTRRGLLGACHTRRVEPIVTDSRERHLTGGDAVSRGKKIQRAHRPHDLGPRVYRTKGSRWFRVDLRPWKGTRVALRNPEDAGWPDHGERTDMEEIAEQWKWAYLALVRDEHRRRVMGLGRSPQSL